MGFVVASAAWRCVDSFTVSVSVDAAVSEVVSLLFDLLSDVHETIRVAQRSVTIPRAISRIDRCFFILFSFLF